MELCLQTSTTACKSFLDRLASIYCWGIIVGRVPLHKFCDIELGLLQHLHLADVTILDGEDGGSFPGDLVSNRSGDELLDQRLQVTFCSHLGHGGNHLCTDSSLLCGLGIACALDLVVLRSCERNAEHTDQVSISCLDVHVSFNDRLLLADQTAKLITGHVHAVEVQQAVVSLNILDAQLNLSESQGFILVQVSEAELKHSSLEVVRGNLGTLCFGNESLPAVLDGKDRGSNQFVPLLLQEGINSLLAASLLALRKSLVLSLLVTKERGEVRTQCYN
jgi:hypothetical protein